MPQVYQPSDTDAVLIAGCQAQHSLAQKYLFERYYGRMLAVACRYITDRSEGAAIVNQAFLKAFQSIHRYQPISPIGAWLRTIVCRTALNHLRTCVRFEEIEGLDEIELSPPLSNEAILSLDAAYIFETIQRLPDAMRTVFNLYEIEGYKHAEIADLLGLSVGTSKWYLSVAKEQLRQLLNVENSIFLNHEIGKR